MSKCQWHKDGTLPENGEIFVFGSNTRGLHSGGAAAVALNKFGAVLGNGVGYQGKSYAIATLDSAYEQLPIDLILQQVLALEDSVIGNGAKYFITRVGCGIAGFLDEEMARMFKGFLNLYNVSLP